MPASGVIERFWCLCTKVRNTSGASMHFSFLPPHGVTLAAGEEKLIPGDILACLPSLGGRHWQRREADAFARAWRAGHLELVHTTGKFVEDLCTGETYIIESHNGAPVSVLPCNERSSYCPTSEIVESSSSSMSSSSQVVEVQL